MRLKLTLVLLLLNLALFSYIFFLETHDPRARTEAEGRLILPAGMVEQAERIGLRGSRVPTPWTLERQEGGWTVTQPVEWAANPYAVRRLLDLLLFLQWETRFPVDSMAEAGKALEDYGLGADAAELEIETAAGHVRLRVGAPTEIGHRLYVLSLDQSEVFVVDRGLLESMGLDAESLIDHSMVDIPPFEVASLNLAVGSENAVRVQMAREGQQWVFNSPIRAAADTAKVNAALDALHDLEVAAFPPAAGASTGLANPALRLNINGNNRQQTLLVGDLVDPDAFPLRRYARLEARPTVVVVPDAPFEVWLTAQESLRQRQFMNFVPAQVGSLEIRRGERSITLQKLEGGRWQLVQTLDGNLTTQPADEAVVEDVLRALATLEAERFVSDAPSSGDLERQGLTDPQRRVTVRLTNGEQRTLLLGDFVTEGLGDTRSNRLYAKRDSASSVYLTPGSILSALSLNGLAFRERVAGSLPAGAVMQQVRIRDLASDRVLLEASRPAGGQWEQTLEALAEPARGAAGGLVQAFRRFPVDRFVSDTFSDPLALDAQRSLPWAFALEAEVRLPGGESGGPETRRFLLSERLGGTTQYAGSPELDLVFTLPQELIDLLHPILFDRPRPDADDRPEAPPTAPAVPVTPPAPDEDAATPPTEEEDAPADAGPEPTAPEEEPAA